LGTCKREKESKTRLSLYRFLFMHVLWRSIQATSSSSKSVDEITEICGRSVVALFIGDRSVKSARERLYLCSPKSVKKNGESNRERTSSSSTSLSFFLLTQFRSSLSVRFSSLSISRLRDSGLFLIYIFF